MIFTTCDYSHTCDQYIYRLIRLDITKPTTCDDANQ